MLTLRGTTLQQFRDQLENDASAARTKSTSALSASQRNSADNCKYSSYSAVPQADHDIKTVPNSTQGTGGKSLPKTYSRMIMEKLKRSSASLSSSSSSTHTSPSHSTNSPCSPSRSSILPCPSVESSPSHYPHSQNFQGPDYLDQSDRTSGANVSKNMSDTSKENWRETGQREFLSPSTDMLTDSGMFHRGGSLNSLPDCKARTNLLRRAMSTPQTPIEEEQGAVSESPNSRVLPLRQDSRPDSMITGSSDSLSSLPEEEESVIPTATEVKDYLRKEWTPVPVNTHLTEQACNTPLRPLADLKLSEEEIKSRRT